MSHTSLLSCNSKCSQNFDTEGKNGTVQDSDNKYDSDSDYEISEREDAARKRQIELQERFLALQNTMNNLRNELHREKELWHKEVEEISRYANGYTYLDNNSSEYIGSDDLYGSENNLDIFGVPEINIIEYEQKLAIYKEALTRAQLEQKATMQRQMAISNYKRRLLEVENMCNMELLRVRQSVQFLQPLQMIASEWNKELQNGDQENGDFEKKENAAKIKASKASDVLESVGNRFYNEMNELFNKISNPLLTVTPSLTWQGDSNGDANTSSQSGIVFSDSSQNLSM